MRDVQFRAATANDLAAVETVIEAAYRPWVAVIGAVPGPLQDDYGPIIADGRVDLALSGSEVIGMMILQPQSDALLVENIAVTPSAQGLGLGKRFMAMAEARARSANLRLMRLYTHVKMASNIAFYETLGFRKVHEAHERGLHRVYMEKPLNQGDP